jgi:hypothetical protein
MSMLDAIMSRESPYAASHKGLRHALGQFQLLAGRTRHDAPDELALLKARGAELSLLLEHHLLAEERYFLAPLRTRADAAALHDIEDHARIEPRQRALMAALARLDGSSATAMHAFYLEVSEFHSLYLAHILHEERVTEPTMFAHFSESEVAAFTAALAREVELPVLLASLRTLIPALPIHEARDLLERLRAAPIFDEVMRVLGDELDPATMRALLGG